MTFSYSKARPTCFFATRPALGTGCQLLPHLTYTLGIFWKYQQTGQPGLPYSCPACRGRSGQQGLMLPKPMAPWMWARRMVAGGDKPVVSPFTKQKQCLETCYTKPERSHCWKPAPAHSLHNSSLPSGFVWCLHWCSSLAQGEESFPLTPGLPLM